MNLNTILDRSPAQVMLYKLVHRVKCPFVDSDSFGGNYFYIRVIKVLNQFYLVESFSGAEANLKSWLPWTWTKPLDSER